MSFKKIYWHIKQSDEFESERLDVQLMWAREYPGGSCTGGLYFVRPENSIGGL